VITHYASGGLGNQLFNYAAARTLADRHGTGLILDLEAYRDQWDANAFRPFLLHHFQVRARYRNWGPRRERAPVWQRARRWLAEDAFAVRVRRAELGFFEGFNTLPKRTVLHDHYISPRFFSGNEARLRQDLAPADDPLTGRDRELLAIIRSSPQPVGVHVRRGDLLLPQHRHLQLEALERYYERAFAHVASRLDAPLFVVFSDDAAWCKAAFASFGGNVLYSCDFSGGDPSAIADFHLLRHCRHFVIANSAFSWWAAWLGAQPDSIVIAPERFESANLLDLDELLPAGWVRMAW
jgi:hypothetical protein